MRIHLFSTVAGPAGTKSPGIHEVPDAEGRALVDAGYAEEVSGKPEAQVVAPREFAMLPRPRPKAAPAKPAPTAAKPPETPKPAGA